MAEHKESGIFIVLRCIQADLIAPKGQYNSFGKYAYRSAEDILEALKPLLKKYDASIVLSDEIVQVGERYYVEATATLYAMGECVGNKAYAREDETKKGMDGAQITGAASSYARKYALNGLLAIDDNNDADTDAYHNQNNQSAGKTQKTNQKQASQQESTAKAPAKNNGSKTITGAQAKAIRTELKNMAEATGSPAAAIGNWFIGKMGVDKPENIPAERLKEAQQIIADAKKVKGIE
ncbi:ERF family protein [Streptococcus equi]|uniref:Putative essential recombination function protein n=2 Tax=Streptococcus equi TaxID=1336 RepID=C0MBB4_STRE4|nr:ERF family protein [Streptococcus equi]QBX15250.1 essential recombination function protein [Streptococcus phage Javan179]MBT1195045.1 ERF family protein [Streptococcus equi subsp. equi]MBT1200266.1 ERF family protein [Streptococcus equi subsp. equi]MBT1203251.1 ERF family protein [Streptococcus equi subsp. equi]MBT1205849.1 ERF family protein [Streptococcus equi subsp. equi]